MATTGLSATTEKGQSVGLTLSGSDADGDPLTYALPSSTTADGGTVSVDATTGAVTYTPPSADYSGTDTFTFTCSDGTDTSAPATVRVVVLGFDDPTTVTIPAGTFTQGDQIGVGDANELPLREVTIAKSFELASTEITNEQYAVVLNWAIDPDGDGDDSDAYIELDNPSAPTSVQIVDTDPRDGMTDWEQEEILDLDDEHCQIVWESGAFGIRDVSGHPDGDVDSRATHPVVEITWYGALFYCWAQNAQTGATANPISLEDWSVDTTIAGWRLPTEAEWEYAARGGWDGGAKYPWWTSDPATQVEPDGSRCNLYGDGDAYEGGTDDQPLSTPVGSYPANGYGLYDMAGNVREWCLDFYHADAYDGLEDDGVADNDGTPDGVDDDDNGEPVTDPTGPEDGTQYILRGNDWFSSVDEKARCAERDKTSPTNANYTFGFRPAKCQAHELAGSG